MVELIHARSGGKMWVHESRLSEYLGAGHKLASSCSAETVEEAPKQEPKKRKSRKKEG